MCCIIQLVIGEPDKHKIARPTTVLHNGSAGTCHSQLLIFSVSYAFTALTLLVEHPQSHPACKNYHT